MIIKDQQKNIAKAHSTIFESVWSDLKSVPVGHTDVIIECNNGSVAAHKIVLASASKFVKNIFLELSDHETVTFVAPDYSVSTVQQFLKLVYTGLVRITHIEDLKNLVQFGKRQMGFSMVYNEQFSMNMIPATPSTAIFEQQKSADNLLCEITFKAEQNILQSDSTSQSLPIFPRKQFEMTSTNQSLNNVKSAEASKTVAGRLRGSIVNPPNTGQVVDPILTKHQSTADNDLAILIPPNTAVINSKASAPIFSSKNIQMPLNVQQENKIFTKSNCQHFQSLQQSNPVIHSTILDETIAIKQCSVLLSKLAIPFSLPPGQNQSKQMSNNKELQAITRNKHDFLITSQKDLESPINEYFKTVENRKPEMNPWPKFPEQKQGGKTAMMPRPDSPAKRFSVRRSKKFQKTKIQCPECSQMFKSPSSVIMVKQVLF